MNLRLARESDIKSMVKIANATFPKEDAKCAKREFMEMFSNALNKPTYIVAVEKQEIIGFAGFISSWFDFNTYEIFWVAVRPDCQKKGIGRKIINEVIRRIKWFKGHSKAHIIILSTAALKFFIKCGFEKVSPLPRNKRYHMMIKLE